MLSKIASNVVSGAIGLIALYVVAKLAYKVGSDMANMENRYKSIAKKASELEHQSRKMDTDGKKKIDDNQPAALEEAKAEEQSTDDEVIVVEDVVSKKPVRKKGFFSHLKGMINHGRTGVIKELLRNPEGHRMEACVNGGAVDIRISKREEW